MWGYSCSHTPQLGSWSDFEGFEGFEKKISRFQCAVLEIISTARHDGSGPDNSLEVLGYPPRLVHTQCSLPDKGTSDKDKKKAAL